MMTKRISLAIVLAIAAAGVLQAANRYVRPDATGANNGTDWTNAWTSIPATLTRGDTYYLADGSYSDTTLDDPVSGSLVITLKKATVSDHGSNTGWSDSYGDGQAIFPHIQVVTAYWVLDGQNRTSDTPMHISPGGTGNYLTFRYVEFSNAAYPPASGPDLVYAATAGAIHDLTFSYCLFLNSGRTCIYTDGARSLLFEHTVFDTCYPHPVAYHGEFMQLRGVSDFTIRWCRFTNHGASLSGVALTGVICSMSNGMTGGYVYGNIFDRVIRALYQDNSGSLTNIYIYNNTSYGNGTGQFITGLGGASNIILRNNVFYADPNCGFSATSEDHNYHSDCVFAYSNVLDDPTDPPTYDGGNGRRSTISGDPCVNSAGEDFHLLNELAGYPGVAIANVGSHRFDLDYYGNVRGADGVWDRGAIEYQRGGSVNRPSAPEGLRLIQQD
jgi:hypothetical protein